MWHVVHMLLAHVATTHAFDSHAQPLFPMQEGCVEHEPQVVLVQVSFKHVFSGLQKQPVSPYTQVWLVKHVEQVLPPHCGKMQLLEDASHPHWGLSPQEAAVWQEAQLPLVHEELKQAPSAVLQRHPAMAPVHATCEWQVEQVVPSHDELKQAS